jgi:hypothetical protein
MTRSVRLLVGTRKGGFIYTSDERRQEWRLAEPLLPGWSFYHMQADMRHDPPLLLAAANHWAWGRSVAKSTDFGKSWDYRSENLGFPPDMGLSVDNVWCVRPGHETESGVVYCGTQPAGLFRSEDWGRSWQPVDGINRHPSRKHWSGTGGGDSCIHSIEVDPRDPNHVYVCVSSGGSFVTRDGGKTWAMFSHTAIAQTPKAREFLAEIAEQFPPALPQDLDPAAIDEMHKMRLDPKNPERVWAQTHVGVFRSDDGGATWADVTRGLPSFHGFPIAVTKRQPDAAFVVPLEFEANNFRVCPGQFTVYRTPDGGVTWQALTHGLPGPNDYQSVYREGLDTDGLEPEGVYVGTSNGQVYASPDGGDHWQRLPGTLPPVLSVTCAVY